MLDRYAVSILSEHGLDFGPHFSCFRSLERLGIAANGCSGGFLTFPLSYLSENLFNESPRCFTEAFQREISTVHCGKIGGRLRINRNSLYVDDFFHSVTEAARYFLQKLRDI